MGKVSGTTRIMYLFKSYLSLFSYSAFKKHLDHTLTDTEVALLSKGGVKFKCQVAAAGIPKSKWVSTTADFPLVSQSTKSNKHYKTENN